MFNWSVRISNPIFKLLRLIALTPDSFVVLGIELSAALSGLDIF